MPCSDQHAGIARKLEILVDMHPVVRQTRRTNVAPPSTEPFAKERQENDPNELLELIQAFFPFLLSEFVLLIGVVGRCC